MEKIIRITEKSVEAAKPQSERYELNDADLKGFILRVSPQGTKSYLVRYRAGVGGRNAPRHVITIGTTDKLKADQARKEAKALLAKISLGDNPAHARDLEREELNLNALFDSFLEEHLKSKRKPSTTLEYERLFRTLFLPKFGKRKATDISKQELAKFHYDLRKTPSQANKLIAAISSLYSFAERRGFVNDGFNPSKRIQKYKENKIERYLSVEELSAFGHAITYAETIGFPYQGKIRKVSPFAAGAMRLLIFTGCRVEEILSLKWEYIDFQRGLIFLPDSKTGQKPIVLNAPSLEVLNTMPRLENNPYVCCGVLTGQHLKDIKRPWELVRDNAGLKNMRLHDLRHTFASYGAGASLGLPIIGKLLGHSQPQTTARYAHLDNDPLRRASETIGNTIANAMAGNRSKTGEVVYLAKGVKNG